MENPLREQVGSVGTGAGNCSRVLVTSMKAAGLLCKPRAVGSKGSWAGRCHLHKPGPGPPPGWGQTTLACSSQAAVGLGHSSLQGQALLLALYRASSRACTTLTGTRRIPMVLESCPRGTPGAALPHCCHPRPEPQRHSPACLLWGCEVVLAPAAGVPWTSGCGLDQPESQSWQCTSPCCGESSRCPVWLSVGGGSRKHRMCAWTASKVFILTVPWL